GNGHQRLVQGTGLLLGRLQRDGGQGDFRRRHHGRRPPRRRLLRGLVLQLLPLLLLQLLPHRRNLGVGEGAAGPGGAVEPARPRLGGLVFLTQLFRLPFEEGDRVAQVFQARFLLLVRRGQFLRLEVRRRQAFARRLNLLQALFLEALPPAQ